MRSHLIQLLVISNLVQMLEQPLQKVEMYRREFAEEAPDVCQAGLKTFDF